MAAARAASRTSRPNDIIAIQPSRLHSFILGETVKPLVRISSDGAASASAAGSEDMRPSWVKNLGAEAYSYLLRGLIARGTDGDPETSPYRVQVVLRNQEVARDADASAAASSSDTDRVALTPSGGLLTNNAGNCAYATFPVKDIGGSARYLITSLQKADCVVLVGGLVDIVIARNKAGRTNKFMFGEIGKRYISLIWAPEETIVSGKSIPTELLVQAAVITASGRNSSDAESTTSTICGEEVSFGSHKSEDYTGRIGAAAVLDYAGVDKMPAVLTQAERGYLKVGDTALGGKRYSASFVDSDYWLRADVHGPVMVPETGPLTMAPEGKYVWGVLSVKRDLPKAAPHKGRGKHHKGKPPKGGSNVDIIYADSPKVAEKSSRFAVPGVKFIGHHLNWPRPETKTAIKAVSSGGTAAELAAIAAKMRQEAKQPRKAKPAEAAHTGRPDSGATRSDLRGEIDALRAIIVRMGHGLNKLNQRVKQLEAPVMESYDFIEASTAADAAPEWGSL